MKVHMRDEGKRSKTGSGEVGVVPPGRVGPACASRQALRPHTRSLPRPEQREHKERRSLVRCFGEPDRAGHHSHFNAICCSENNRSVARSG